eukprot:251715_1
MGIDLWFFVEFRPAGQSSWQLYRDPGRVICARYDEGDARKVPWEMSRNYMFYCRNSRPLTTPLSDALAESEAAGPKTPKSAELREIARVGQEKEKNSGNWMDEMLVGRAVNIEVALFMFDKMNTYVETLDSSIDLEGFWGVLTTAKNNIFNGPESKCAGKSEYGADCGKYVYMCEPCTHKNVRKYWPQFPEEWDKNNINAHFRALEKRERSRGAKIVADALADA